MTWVWSYYDRMNQNKNHNFSSCLIWWILIFRYILFWKNWFDKNKRCMFCFKILWGINNFSHVFLMRPKSVKIAYWVSLTWWPLTCDWWSVTTLAVLKSGKVGLITNEQNSAQFWPQVNGNFRWQPQSIIDCGFCKNNNNCYFYISWITPFISIIYHKD